jgi:hypothetical protein
MTGRNRYFEKPLVRLLELYVLHSIGEISTDDMNRMFAMTPKLQEIYGRSGEWPDIIAWSVGFPHGTSREIRAMWQRNQETARANGITLQPQKFAEMFVDDNFPL